MPGWKSQTTPMNEEGKFRELNWKYQLDSIVQGEKKDNELQPNEK